MIDNEKLKPVSAIDLAKDMPSKDSRAWLISWNQNNWDWENYSEICEDTQNGK